LESPAAQSPDFLERIRARYLRLQGDSTELFEEVLSISAEIGLEPTLALLETCCTEKRLAWVAGHYHLPRPSDADAVNTGFAWFYHEYLHAHLPEEGEIIYAGPERITARWWNGCPTLDACVKLGLDTRVVCRLAYHRPVDAFLKAIHPHLRFERNYECIRPYCGYCEETILLEE
jgi:hypothetical protein